MSVREGKLSTNELKECFQYLKIKNEDIIKSSLIGEDCALIDIGKKILITTDPITTEVENIGMYLMYVSTNDIFAAGGIPKFGLITMIFPTTFSFDEVKEIFRNVGERASELGVDIVGGHTEFSDAVVRPVLSATILGELISEYNLKNIKSGDLIYVTKDLGIEGNKILSYKKGIQSKYEDDLLSVAKEGKILQKYSEVVAMHDVTEGGIKGALEEMLYTLNLGAKIDFKKLPFDETTVELVEEYKMDLKTLISSGSMVVILNQPSQAIENELKNNNIKFTCIGKVVENNKVVFEI